MGQWKALRILFIGMCLSGAALAGTPGDTRTYEVSDCNISFCIIGRSVETLGDDYTWRETERSYRIVPRYPPPPPDLPPTNQK
jgi:hypothetical protein